MKKANGVFAGVLMILVLTAPAFGQLMRSPGTLSDHAQVVVENDDFTLYRIPEGSEAFCALAGDGLEVEAGGREAAADPVLLFNVLTLKDGLIYFYFNEGDEVLHQMEFYLSSDSRVRFKWAVTEGPQAWSKASRRIELEKGYYVFTGGGKGEKKTYTQPGDYMFKGSVLADGVKRSARNTNTSRFFVRD